MKHLLLLIIFSSCVGFQYKPEKMCKIHKEYDPIAIRYEVNYLPPEDVFLCYVACVHSGTGEKLEDSKCGGNFQSGEVPVINCDGISGFKNRFRSTKFVPFKKSLYNFVKGICGKYEQAMKSLQQML